MQKIHNPELVFGLVGPIGVNLDSVVEFLSAALQEVGYQPQVIHLTSLMMEVFKDLVPDVSSYQSRYRRLIANADEVRQRAQNPAAMAGLAIGEIQRIRKSQTGMTEKPALGHAYILRQFKRSEEISLLREVYGRKFVQVSVYLDKHEREAYLASRIRNFGTQIIEDADARKESIDLIDIDYKEKNEFGQRVSDVFHLGDVFVRGDGSEGSKKTVRRFIRAFFGDNQISPTKAEYGLYAAAGAALRSIDLSRQVGAAIFSNKGEVVSLGCNEVPKAFGGTYWSDDDIEPKRDFEIGQDWNHSRKLRVLHDLIDRMGDEGLLSTSLMDMGSVSEQVEHLTGLKSIRDSKVMDIIEFGRMIHAEMSAITDAARVGRPVKDATLYVTTFPCHLCAKHIVSAGIRKVVFLEPYPKSYAEDLLGDSMTLSASEADMKVHFEPFIGISPRRYRDIFEKGKRKDDSGKAITWSSGAPVPRVEDRSGAYIENEEFGLLSVAALFSQPA